MSQNADNARRLIEVWKNRDYSVFDELVAVDMVNSGPFSEPFQGRDGQKAFYQTFLGAFPNVTFEIKDVRERGNWVEIDVVYNGAMTGELMGIAPTRKTAVVPVTTSYRFQDGIVVEAAAAWDPNAMFAQLGVQM